MARIGLVLGAGGVTGEAFHHGVLRGIREMTGWDATGADVVVGTSAGSLVAASLRRPDDAPTVDLDAPATGSPGLLPDVRPLVSSALQRRLPRAGVALSSLLPAGHRSAEFFTAGLRRRHGGDWPEQRTWVVAVRRRDGRRVAFGSKGAPETDLATAVTASCAIPGYFQPVTVDGDAYVDGGVHSPTNADLLARTRLDVVLVSSPMSVVPQMARPRLDLPLRLLFHRYLSAEVRRLRTAGIEVLTFEPDADALPALGLHPLRAENIDEVARAATRMTHRRLESDRAGEVRTRLTPAGTFARGSGPVRQRRQAL